VINFVKTFPKVNRESNPAALEILVGDDKATQYKEDGDTDMEFGK